MGEDILGNRYKYGIVMDNVMFIKVSSLMLPQLIYQREK